MKTYASLTEAQLERLRRVDSVTLANAIERFNVRLRNTGFTDRTIRCFSPKLPPIAGYAVTARVSTSEPPMEGRGFRDGTEWWQHIVSVPKPRVVVLEDVGNVPGLGALVGGVHASILSALGCVGVVTNGAVRAVRFNRGCGFAMFAGNLSVSHAYAHIIEFGGPVTVGGMKVAPGDLLHGGVHGVQTVPMEIAERIPDAAERILHENGQLIALCQSSDVTLEKIVAKINLGPSDTNG